MLTFKRHEVNGMLGWRVLAGTNLLGTIFNPGPAPGSLPWHGVAPDGTRLQATSKPRIAEQLQAHARRDLRS